MRALVTGGAGFIGSALVRRLVSESVEVFNIDKLTYAGDLRTVADVAAAPNYQFLQADICDGALMSSAIRDFRPTAIIHLAAESHVDRSIDAPADFLRTNVMGVWTMLDAALAYVKHDAPDPDAFRFVLISTDEVYGSLGADGRFSETSAYAPNSPYAASKASADHLARAWHKTYGLPAIITNCSNNYGPFQHPEKLIPTVIRAALAEQPIPIYGTGANVRDWIFVDDHVQGLIDAIARGHAGEKYNFGGDAETSNLEMVRMICAHLDALAPRRGGGSYAELIAFVPDRPGHDFRYAVDSAKAERELGWTRRETLQTGLSNTVRWYLDNGDWFLPEKNFGRQGLSSSMVVQGR
ncbi:dTDP-glucose 4,6-dehydratase [Nitratireductor sp. StC3]|uniref:dTDP-glucose 4,6-dehydratase n=1 Tax=Nitratireductor sp. StC3 TaxID=2126741 RepID=UPI000D0DD948|nr:dTDP-glucose 4,6-dehydratase [Nitratireductor sp. StC3]PSM18282.1 dTDP-glucose 4,6-dehydratase [Nitratireductor sp. StC3]